MIERAMIKPSLPALSLASLALLALAGCGGSASPSSPVTSATPTPAPAPTPAPTPSQPAACRLTAPTVDCATHEPKPQEMAPALQQAIEAAMNTPGVMYTEYTNRIRDLDTFRRITTDHLTAAGLCGVWDYGNEKGDEIFVRSADGCVAEAYDLISGDGGVRIPGKGSNVWQEGWGVEVPGPKPSFSKVGDLACSLPGDRSTFCFQIKGSPGEYGPDVYRLVVEVMNENPALFDKNDFAPAQGEFIPEQLRVAAWRILDVNAYVAALERKLRGAGYCAYIEGNDILRVKRVSRGNIIHEEMDVVQEPVSGGSFAAYVIKDRCHNAGF
jgi:hypothetical protein